MNLTWEKGKTPAVMISRHYFWKRSSWKKSILLSSKYICVTCLYLVCKKAKILESLIRAHCSTYLLIRQFVNIVPSIGIRIFFRHLKLLGRLCLGIANHKVAPHLVYLEATTTVATLLVHLLARWYKKEFARYRGRCCHFSFFSRSCSLLHICVCVLYSTMYYELVIQLCVCVS